MKVLFAVYDKFNLRFLEGPASALRFLGHEVQFFFGAVNAPSLGGWRFEAPLSSTLAFPTRTSLERSLLHQLKNTHTDLKTLSQYSRDWESSFSKWFAQRIDEYHPDLTVVCVGEVETRCVANVLQEQARPFVYWLPPFYEFKAAEPFLPFATPEAPYWVSGMFGRQRLKSLGVGLDGTRALGFSGKGVVSQRLSEGRALLFLSQGLRDEERTVDWLRAYALSRGIPFCFRPHPSLLSSTDPLETLSDACARAAVSVSLHSLAGFECIGLGVPTFYWNPGPWPDFHAFGEDKDIPTLRTVAGLERALDDCFKDRQGVWSKQRQRLEHYWGPFEASVENFLKAALFYA